MSYSVDLVAPSEASFKSIYPDFAAQIGSIQHSSECWAYGFKWVGVESDGTGTLVGRYVAKYRDNNEIKLWVRYHKKKFRLVDGGFALTPNDEKPRAAFVNVNSLIGAIQDRVLEYNKK